MKRKTTLDGVAVVLAILFCPLLLFLPLLVIVWILAPYFVEQWKEDWKTERGRRRVEKEMRKRGEPSRPLMAADRRGALRKIQKKYNLTRDEIAVIESRIRPVV